MFNGNGSNNEPELAFELLRAVHNRGYVTEAASAVILWAGEAGYPRLWATVWDWNVASRGVLENSDSATRAQSLPKPPTAAAC